MSRLVWNDNPNWPGTNNGAWVGLPQTAQVSGDVAGNGTPRSIATRNPQWVRVPESIVRYRDGGGLYGNGGSMPAGSSRSACPTRERPAGLLR